MCGNAAIVSVDFKHPWSLVLLCSQRSHLFQIGRTSAKDLKCGFYALLFYRVVLMTLVMLMKVVPDKVQEIKDRTVKELEIIHHLRDGG